jgi:hypothetical protein
LHFDQLGQRRTRHQHTFVDVELMSANHMRCVRYGGGNALGHTSLEQRQDRGALGRAKLPAVNVAASSCRSPAPKNTSSAASSNALSVPCRTTAATARTAASVVNQLLDRRRIRSGSVTARRREDEKSGS